MNNETVTWTVARIIEHYTEGCLITNASYQRPIAWTAYQQKFMIDSILRGYDVPKIYLRVIVDPLTGIEKYEVVDGQQRILSLCGFASGGFATASRSMPVVHMSKGSIDISSKRFGELPLTLQTKFTTASISVCLIRNASPEETREMFLRLQNGTPLTSQEKRNAFSGEIVGFVKGVVNSFGGFFNLVQPKNKGLKKDKLAAQFLLIALTGKATSVNDAYLNQMYKDYRAADFNTNPTQLIVQAKEKITKVLNRLSSVFSAAKDVGVPELGSGISLALFSFVLKMINANPKALASKESCTHFYEWFTQFCLELSQNKQKLKNKIPINSEWNDYFLEMAGVAVDGLGVKVRADFMEKHYENYKKSISFEDEPLIGLDPIRDFSDSMRQEIWRRDEQKCQLKIACDGSKQLHWNNWHCDHKVPHSKGGETSVENGQVACPECNLKKSNKNGLIQVQESLAF